MHAAVLRAYGATPVYEPFEEPVAGVGQVVVEVTAAGVNPVDVRKASGTFVSGPPPLPSVVGSEGVGRVAGQRVYFDASVAPFGAFAERTLVGDGDPIELPDELDDGVAIALGISGLAAWLPLAWRAQLRPGETVLVLGATGIVGQLAVQVARLLGAGRIVAAGRDPEMLERARQLGADAIVELGEGIDGAALTAAFRDAAGGDVDVVHDPLWGAPAAAAVEALGVDGRLVQLGQSAGAESTLSSAAIRGRHVNVLGYLNFLVPSDVRRDAYRVLAEHAVAGRIAVEVERMPLARVGEAWKRVQRSAHRKLVLVP